jgi:hypothetical protein
MSQDTCVSIKRLLTITCALWCMSNVRCMSNGCFQSRALWGNIKRLLTVTCVLWYKLAYHAATTS